METLTGENSPAYKKVVSKSQVHRWMEIHYGKPKICEMKGCEGKSIWFDWAKKTGMEYERNRENFLRLCRKCHRRYDLTPEIKAKAEKNLWWARGIKSPGPWSKYKKEGREIINYNKGRKTFINCKFCEKSFHQLQKRRQYCSVKCSAEGQRRDWKLTSLSSNKPSNE